MKPILKTLLLLPRDIIFKNIKHIFPKCITVMPNVYSHVFITVIWKKIILVTVLTLFRN